MFQSTSPKPALSPANGKPVLLNFDGAALCSQPTISRMENLADTRALIRMAHETVRFYGASFARTPERVVLDIDDTFNTVHGHQQLRLFNACYDDSLCKRNDRHCYSICQC